MKQILVMMAEVVLVGCSKDTSEPVPPTEEKVIADPIVEEAIREFLEKPEDELTEADLEKVTKAGVAELKKALPNCEIHGL